MVINIIQSECRSRSPDIVYGPIFIKFGEWVGLWTKGAEKYANLGYHDNRCHGNQKNLPKALKHPNCYGILSGGALEVKEFVAMEICYHGDHGVVIATKTIPIQVI